MYLDNLNESLANCLSWWINNFKLHTPLEYWQAIEYCRRKDAALMVKKFLSKEFPITCTD